MISKEYNGYLFGFVDLTINEVFKYYPSFFQPFNILITCLDSSPRLPDLTKWMQYLKRTGWRYQIIGDKVWIHSANLFDIFEQGKTFYHFDEVYLVQGIPQIDAMPYRHYTTDGRDFSENVPQEFIEMFLKLGATRYLSDGCGLNFVCESLEITKKLEEIAKTVGLSSF